MTKSAITTHVLDTEQGCPASGIAVSLYRSHESVPIAEGMTDQDGRIIVWPQSFALQQGEYRLCFELSAWFEQQQRSGFYPRATIDFIVTDTASHYHVPLLLSGHGYSTYRGS
ncbi:hydroxyisourate hydrolase [Neiella marina]|uniref:5-hydroxyisourate hydrolase n=1 Tax=Neiella holothuriorum TaxID=2870530 RepID=A0ABS7EC26_9GAMM|nr:hydroxyisourate hydrolase [Neiella holothuriorum]MBW8189795.1 hydroxyisourate hydrolase [Neiella holothuriorum]